MITDAVLYSVKAFLESTGILNSIPENTYEVQVTPDERPFAYSGSNVVTLYPESLSRTRPITDQRKFTFSFEVCITKRVTYTPYDRQYQPLYYDTLVSLSTMSEIIALSIDRSNTLVSNINNRLGTNRTSLISSIVGSGATVITANLNTAEVISPIIVSDLIKRPIPRDDNFFTAYSEKRDLLQRTADDGIVTSGYSMKVRVEGPDILLSAYCS